MTDTERLMLDRALAERGGGAVRIVDYLSICQAMGRTIEEAMLHVVNTSR
jgi:hypothetical protein